MIIKNNISHLIDWIEDNKHYPLRIDEIAQKAGYSKWYLQRAFSEVTGVNLATYCRKRRLSLAVLTVKYTEMPLADIASWFKYDSQQTLTNEFVKYYNVTPRNLRKSSGLNLKNIYPSLQNDIDTDYVNFKLVDSPVKEMYGIEYSYSIAIDQMDKHPVKQRKIIWDEFLSLFERKPEKIYCLTGPVVRNTKGSQVGYRYFLSVHDLDYCELLPRDIKKISMNSGQAYAVFEYKGHYSKLEGFIRNIYNIYLPRENFIRSDGEDIQEFIINGRSTFGDTSGYVEVNYYVPVENSQ
ncbi:helix-turn-helix domain-containing protein [Pantoea rwandensis]|uniref:HTH araC/xylS-type domain-containing protein n=1 Tax=Pantoea rwandensis TaxID=1076550 RepID=A0A1X1D3H4_9GAMM|nr:helix-turn-helix domain-containing protein [Pantoea rwandensis]ORM71219.1 hypothetical protein HA51_04930 [Pantoea rwandensis]